MIVMLRQHAQIYGGALDVNVRLVCGTLGQINHNALAVNVMPVRRHIVIIVEHVLMIMGTKYVHVMAAITGLNVKLMAKY